MADLSKYKGTAAVHNMATLDQYDLFGNSNSLLLKAFLISPEEIILTVGGDIKIPSGELELFEWDYTHFDASSQKYILTNKKVPDFSQQRNKITIALKSWDIVANYVLKYRDEWINVFLDPSIGGITDKEFNAYAEENFGVSIIPQGASFKVWSPPASKIEVLLFDKNQQPVLTKSPLWMKKVCEWCVFFDGYIGNDFKYQLI